MKKNVKQVRIEADNGEALLISQQRYQNLLQTLDALANDTGARRKTYAKK